MAIPWKWQRFLVAALLIVAASSLRIWPLQALGSTLTWLTFYPAVMIAAIYGGLAAGLLTTGIIVQFRRCGSGNALCPHGTRRTRPFRTQANAQQRISEGS